MSPAQQLKSDKNAVRQSCLQRRDALDAQEREAKSASICGHVLQHLIANNLAENREISVFLPIRSEVDLTGLLQPLAQAGALLSLPVVLDKKTIVFRSHVPGDALVDAGFGTIGPPAEAQIVDPQLLLMPLAGFDRSGARLGYGAGHYDRALQRLTAKGFFPLAIGIAFGLQEVPDVPVEVHDVPLAAIITENGVCEFEGKSE
ncbi:MAG: 5-formyltetrahydrofolate cyclo-ligase [Rhizobiales bacterium]|nr:5-formyltetrahydrofolate cyclo-ligase [Hyphomicrobiales bacterium]